MTRVTVDGNEAAVSVAYRLNEVCCIYPITPSSPMAELADVWSSAQRPNVWGTVPTVVEMQSEGGAAGALHGALQSGALTTTFTSSQGLLLMIPNMYKIAGELTSAVINVAARSVAAQALSIFGDHSDVMAVRQTGFAMLASASVQEAQDLALIAQAATLATRVPFVHFFDGFRTSHELNTIETLTDDDLRALVPEELVRAHRGRALSPERPFIRGTAQNPDVFFQARETVNPFYARVPGVVADLMAQLGERTGRKMGIVDYTGHPEADRVLVLMGSGAETSAQTVAALVEQGERVGVVQMRLYRPFPTTALLAALPATVRTIGVLDRTKEPGSIGEPLFLDVVAALAEAFSDGERPVMPRITGGRYGLSSKEFTPAMVAGVFAELARERPRRRFTIGIDDDVSGTSVDYDPSFDIESPTTFRAVFFGLGSDGTVSANKNTIKIMGADGLFAQAYFVYDSKKSGSQTESHLRFGPDPIHAPYLVSGANFIGCHQFRFLDKVDVLGRAAPGATLLLNCRLRAEKVWDALPRRVQEQILDKGITLYAVDADRIARDVGLAGRINIVLQTCFFAISDVLPRERAIARIKKSVQKMYGNRGAEVLAKELAAVDGAVAGLQRIEVPEEATSTRAPVPTVPDSAPEFVRTVTAEMMAGRGNLLPVSALPVDGTYPSGTTAYEKRNVSELVAVWDSDSCIQCGNCSFVCPHSVIRSKFYDESQLAGAPDEFASAPLDAVGLPNARYSLQVYVEDCTGCGLCVEACPVVIPGSATLPGNTVTKAINLAATEPRLATERKNIDFFETLPTNDRSRVDFGTVRGTQFLQPLFEFSGACAGCGETPYLKLLSQLFGDRLMIANATGCSSIYGGNLPTTPWATNAEGRGPAWSNSLFEDNAEFGLGLRLASDGHLALARRRLTELRDALGGGLVDDILSAPQLRESELAAQRERVAELRTRLDGLDPALTADLLSVVDSLVRRSVWIVGGDGWAYDIGSGGLDHVLATGRNVNVLVLDTEVYSNTGGQMSKSTPLGAVAKFAAAGKTVPKKDLALQAIAYGNVYVAKVAMGADAQQTLQAFREAEAYDGPSLVIGYSQCIAHGIDMSLGMDQQYRAVASGHWPLLRYDPVLRAAGANPFLLDSHRPRIPLSDYVYRELRYRSLANSDPVEAERLLGMAEQAIEQRWNVYEEMASRGPEHFHPDARRGAVMDLSTRYLGLDLRNPLVASASPLSKTVDGVRRLADAGVGAVVLYSLFEEQLHREAERNARLADAGSESFAEALTYFPAGAATDHGPRRYLSLLERAAAAVSVPVIGSLNASTPGSWARYARSMQDCGAAAIELNIYFLPGDSHVGGRDVEQLHLDILAGVKDVVTVPVAVKLSPYFSATAEMARRLDLAGANGLVLFNRFLQPDIDPEALTVVPGVPLSTASEARLAMTWITLLHGRIDCSLAATTGVETSTELIKYLLSGADVVMTASALLRHGPEYAAALLDGLCEWMARKGFATITDFRGLFAVPVDVDETARERADYVNALRRANCFDYGPW